MSDVEPRDFLPGDGPTQTVSVSLHAGTIEAVRSRVGKRGVSSYVEEALQRQIERDHLNELIGDFEAKHGQITDAEVAAMEAQIFGNAQPRTEAA